MAQHYPRDQGLAEYHDAETYERDNTWAADDEFYLTLAREIGGPVLDAGCGTGRLARGMAAAGLDVTGLDVTPEMLRHAEALSEGLDIEWVLGDVRTMQLDRRFRLITMTSHGFQHLLTDEDILAFFDRAREHLLDGGYLAFETRNYAGKSWGKSGELELWGSSQENDGRWVDEFLTATLDPDTGVEDVTFIKVTRETGEREVPHTYLRYLPVEHLNDLLERSGFAVVQQYGDWQKGALGPDRQEVISVCQLTSR